MIFTSEAFLMGKRHVALDLLSKNLASEANFDYKVKIFTRYVKPASNIKRIFVKR